MESKKDDNKKISLRIENIYSHAFWLEKFNKENKFQLSLFENYLPNTKSNGHCNKFPKNIQWIILSGEAFTPKFYSKNCEMDMTNKDYQKYLKLVETSNEMEMDRNTLPVCQNQE